MNLLLLKYKINVIESMTVNAFGSNHCIVKLVLIKNHVLFLVSFVFYALLVKMACSRSVSLGTALNPGSLWYSAGMFLFCRPCR